MGDQAFAALRLLDLAGARQQRFQIAIGVDQLSRGLDADARHARHIVDTVARQRLDMDHLAGFDAELLQHLGIADALVLHGVQHRHAFADQLHQVLVGRNDGALGAGLARNPRIGGDQVVGLIADHVHARHAKGASGIAHQRELRHQVFRRRRAVGFIFVVDRVAESLLTGVENDRQVRRRIGALHVLQQLPQHVAVTRHRAGGQAIGLAGQRRQGVIGPEQIARTVHQIEMIALFQGAQWWTAPAFSTKRLSQ